MQSIYKRPCGAAILAALATSLHAQVPTPAQPVQDTLPVLAHAKDLGKMNGTDLLSITIALEPRDLAGLEETARQVSDPNSLLYRMFMTPEEIGDRFGATQDQMDAMASYLRANGMKITLIPKSRMAILAEGTVAQAQKAFQTQIDNFVGPTPDGREKISFHANRTPIKLPANLAGFVTTVEGLEDYTRPVPRNTTLLNPTLTRVLYNSAPLYNAGKTGAGIKVGISNWDGFKLADAGKYVTQFSLPTPLSNGIPTNVTVSGTAPKQVQGEGDLDLQMVLGMAPLASITMYSSTNDLIGVLQRELDADPDIVSESWGWSLPASTAEAAHVIHYNMTLAGITYMCASGDNGTSLEPYSYPNYDPLVMQVGGTVATVNNTNAPGTRVSELSWTGSGGGYSTNSASFNTKEGWQSAYGPSGVDKRMGPDIALHASGSGTGAYQFFFRGRLTGGYIGTSFACPVFAGCLAVAMQSSGKRNLGALHQSIYTNAALRSCFTDMSDNRSNGNLPNGTQSKCVAGWDTVTGWGYPNINSLASNL